MRTIIAAAALAMLAGPAGATDSRSVACGKDWISFQPLSPEAFSTKPGLNEYTVRKADIRRLSRPKIGHEFGYINIVPLKGDLRKDGEYRVSRSAFVAIQDCLLGIVPAR